MVTRKQLKPRPEPSDADLLRRAMVSAKRQQTATQKALRAELARREAAQQTRRLG